MPEQQTIIVKRQGCGSGCASALFLVLALAIAYKYWYVTVPLLLLVAAGYAYVERDTIGQQFRHTRAAPVDLPPETMAKGHWDIDPVNPDRERWREPGGAWSDSVRPRQDWLPGERHAP